MWCIVRDFNGFVSSDERKEMNAKNDKKKGGILVVYSR